MRRFWLALLLATAVVGFAPRPIEAQFFSVTQITKATGGFGSAVPSINDPGTRIAFVSDRNLTPGSPGNADGNSEIFLFDTTSGLFTQITNSTGGGNSSPSINAAGTRIAFVSDRNLTPGSPGNADGNSEIFLFDTTSGLFTQVTNTTGCVNRGPSINNAGTRIAFESTCNLTPGSPGNADNNFEIFLFDTTAGLTQITNTTGANIAGDSNLEPSINAAGTRIAFVSTRDLTPGSPGNADGSLEIFLFDTTTGIFTQITNTIGFSNSEPSINAAGTRIAFNSFNDLTPGRPGNVDQNAEIFLFDTTTGLFTQITNTTFGIFPVTGYNLRPKINAAGTRIAFVSDRDLVPAGPGNTDANFEIFLFDTTTHVFTQITQSVAGLPGVCSPSIDASGNHIAFGCNRDLVPGSPGNADGNFEVFLAADTGAAAIPTLSEWMQLVAAALLVVSGLLALRRGGAQAPRTRS